VVEDIAGVVGAVASMVGATADIGEEVIDANQICTSSMVVIVKLLKPMVQVIWSMANVRSSATAMKSWMMTI